MKSFAVAAAIGVTVAGASKFTAPLAPRSSTLPEVVTKGNGKNPLTHGRWDPMIDMDHSVLCR